MRRCSFYDLTVRNVRLGHFFERICGCLEIIPYICSRNNKKNNEEGTTNSITDCDGHNNDGRRKEEPG